MTQCLTNNNKTILYLVIKNWRYKYIEGRGKQGYGGLASAQNSGGQLFKSQQEPVICVFIIKWCKTRNLLTVEKELRCVKKSRGKIEEQVGSPPGVHDDLTIRCKGIIVYHCVLAY